MDLSQFQQNYTPVDLGYSQPQKKKKGFLQDQISTGGGIAGGAAGAAIGTAILPGVGTLAGALIGGALGGGGGQALENKVVGDPLSKDVAKEAAINGIFSAGPLKLLKFGNEARLGVQAARAGETTLADALANAGSKAADFSILKPVGDKLAGSGEKLIAKQFRLNPTQQFNFKNTTGEEATAVLRRFGVKAPEEVSAKIAPLQDAFDSVVHQIPDIPQKTLETGLKKVYEPLLGSVSLTEKQLGQQLKTQAEEIVARAQNGSIPASEVNNFRKTFDSAVKYTQRGAPDHNVLKETADALRTTLQKQADNAGVKFNGQSFKELGLDLNKLRKLEDVLGKQEYLGTGSLPLSLPNLLGAGAGGAMGGGPVGGLLGMVGTSALNSNAGRRLVANTAVKGGEKLAAKGAAESSLPQVIKGIATRVGGVGLATGLANQSVGNNTQQAAATTRNAMNQATTNITPQYGGTSGLSSALEGADSPFEDTSPYAMQNIQKNVESLIKQGAKQSDIAAYLSNAADYQKLTAAGPNQLSLSDTAIGRATDYENAINQLGELDQTFKANPVSNPLTGKLRGANPFDTTAQTQQAQINGVRQIVGKALEGGVLRKEDEAKYAKILPTLSDSPQVARNKIAQVSKLLQQNYQQYLTLQQQAGKGAGQLPATLDQALSGAY